MGNSKSTHYMRGGTTGRQSRSTSAVTSPFHSRHEQQLDIQNQLMAEAPMQWGMNYGVLYGNIDPATATTTNHTRRGGRLMDTTPFGTTTKCNYDFIHFNRMPNGVSLSREHSASRISAYEECQKEQQQQQQQKNPYIVANSELRSVSLSSTPQQCDSLLYTSTVQQKPGFITGGKKIQYQNLIAKRQAGLPPSNESRRRRHLLQLLLRRKRGAVTFVGNEGEGCHAIRGDYGKEGRQGRASSPRFTICDSSIVVLNDHGGGQSVDTAINRLRSSYWEEMWTTSNDSHAKSQKNRRVRGDSLPDGGDKTGDDALAMGIAATFSPSALRGSGCDDNGGVDNKMKHDELLQQGPQRPLLMCTDHNCCGNIIGYVGGDGDHESMSPEPSRPARYKKVVCKFLGECDSDESSSGKGRKEDGGIASKVSSGSLNHHYHHHHEQQQQQQQSLQRRGEKRMSINPFKWYFGGRRGNSRGKSCNSAADHLSQHSMHAKEGGSGEDNGEREVVADDGQRKRSRDKSTARPMLVCSRVENGGVRRDNEWSSTNPSVSSVDIKPLITADYETSYKEFDVATALPPLTTTRACHIIMNCREGPSSQRQLDEHEDTVGPFLPLNPRHGWTGGTAAPAAVNVRTTGGDESKEEDLKTGITLTNENNPDDHSAGGGSGKPWCMRCQRRMALAAAGGDSYSRESSMSSVSRGLDAMTAGARAGGGSGRGVRVVEPPRARRATGKEKMASVATAAW